MVNPTVTEVLSPRRQVEHDRFADTLAVHDPVRPPAPVVRLPSRSRSQLRVAA